MSLCQWYAHVELSNIPTALSWFLEAPQSSVTHALVTSCLVIFSTPADFEDYLEASVGLSCTSLLVWHKFWFVQVSPLFQELDWETNWQPMQFKVLVIHFKHGLGPGYLKDFKTASKQMVRSWLWSPVSHYWNLCVVAGWVESCCFFHFYYTVFLLLVRRSDLLWARRKPYKFLI